MSTFRNIRVIPVLLVAIFSLVVLKVAGLVLNGGYVFEYEPRPTKRSWAQENFNFPGRPVTEEADITGSTHGEPKAATKADTKEDTKEGMPKPAMPESKSDGMVMRPEENQRPVSASERAILERLQSRRQELEARAREIEIRESLLKAAEKRIETRVDEMKSIEAKSAAQSEQKSEADNARFKSIVTMYEGMKPKDAAKVFDRLEMPVLIEIASQIAPRKMSDIMGQMLPESAERLTVELAHRAGGGDKPAMSAELPKIEGRPMPLKSN